VVACLYNRRIRPMPDPVRHDEDATASDTGRETQIEELLLAGLDHYFSGQHELAINVWTRVLFLDRSHARARAYIERARSAVAERQREGEELLQTGAAAFERGDAVRARRLLNSAVERGASPDEALALLDRLDRLEPAPDLDEPAGPGHRERRRRRTNADAQPGRTPALTLLLVLAVGLAGGVLAMIYWNTSQAPAAAAAGAAARPQEAPLPVPAAADVALSRGRALYAKGRLREALAVLEEVLPGDPRRPQADELEIEIQHRLLQAARAAGPPQAAPPPAAR
jgi:tetratricopeptide (TPR) repeat protein